MDSPEIEVPQLAGAPRPLVVRFRFDALPFHQRHARRFVDMSIVRASLPEEVANVVAFLATEAGAFAQGRP